MTSACSAAHHPGEPNDAKLANRTSTACFCGERLARLPLHNSLHWLSAATALSYGRSSERGCVLSGRLRRRKRRELAVGVVLEPNSRRHARVGRRRAPAIAPELRRHGGSPAWGDGVSPGSLCSRTSLSEMKLLSYLARCRRFGDSSTC